RLPAGILISSPVCGLRPVRADVATCSDALQPGIETLLPLATASETVEKRESSTLDTADWLCPVALAMLATSSVLVMDLSAMWLSSTAARRHRFIARTERLLAPRLGRSTATEYTHVPRNHADFRHPPRITEEIPWCGCDWCDRCDERTV